MTCEYCGCDYELCGQVICRHLPDGRRAFLPMLRLVTGTPDRINQIWLERAWERHGPISGRVWNMPLDREDYEADMRIWRQVFGPPAGVDLIDRMATWGEKGGER